MLFRSVWREMVESQFTAFEGQKFRHQINWGDWEDEPVKTGQRQWNWHSNHGEDYLVKDGLVVARVFLDDINNLWFGRINGTQEVFRGLTQESCKTAVEKHLRDAGVIS